MDARIVCHSALQFILMFLSWLIEIARPSKVPRACLRRSERASCRPFVRSQDKLPPASRFVFGLKFEDCLVVPSITSRGVYRSSGAQPISTNVDSQGVKSNCQANGYRIECASLRGLFRTGRSTSRMLKCGETKFLFLVSGSDFGLEAGNYLLSSSSASRAPNSSVEASLTFHQRSSTRAVLSLP